MNGRAVPVIVSDHAVLRWLEREHGLDIGAIKALLAGKVSTGAQLQAVAVCTGKVRLLLQQGDRPGTFGATVVVTALPRSQSFPGARDDGHG